MKKSIKKKWIDALKSGKYRQAEGALRVKNRFCCLGVLCDLYKKEHPSAHWLPDGSFQVKYKDKNKYNYEEEKNYLPKPVMKWAGLEIYRGIVYYDGCFTTDLTELNDDGVPFKEIAKIIDEKA